MGESRVEVKFLHPDLAVAYWDVWAPLIEKALPEEELRIPDALRAIRDRTMHLALVVTDERVSAAALLQVVEYPACRRVRIVALGGFEMDKWKHQLDEFVVSFAEGVGACGVEFAGRKGFLRALRGMGFEEKYVVMIKEVRYGQEPRDSSCKIYTQPTTVPAALH